MAEITELTAATFDAAIATGVTLVDFWAPWCSPCKMMGALLDKQIAPQIDPRVKIAKVNVDDNTELAAKFEILSIPAILIFKDGVLENRLDGVQQPQNVINAAQALLG